MDGHSSGLSEIPFLLPCEYLTASRGARVRFDIQDYTEHPLPTVFTRINGKRLYCAFLLPPWPQVKPTCMLLVTHPHFRQKHERGVRPRERTLSILTRWRCPWACLPVCGFRNTSELGNFCRVDWPGGGLVALSYLLYIK